ncbi:MAG: hypothetical protein Fur0043_25130 [Anaerolineales bacterium]
MSEFSDVPMSGGPEPFYQTWLKAITRPNEQNFAEMALSVGASPNKAYLWVFLTNLVNMLVGFALQGVNMRQLRQFLPPEAGQYFSQSAGGVGLLGVLCGAPVSAALSVLFFALGVAIIQWIAKMFGGQGDYGKLVYVMGAIAAPIALVSAALTLLGAIPFIGILFGLVSMAVGLYTLFLNIAAVKGVNRFGWGQAAGSVLLPGVVVFLLVCCCIVAVLVLLGPAIGDVFSTINQSLGVY